jgi:uncharacterized protein YdeI (YjbR/CyaY-like superfamily)
MKLVKIKRSIMKSNKSLYFASREDWRKWLEKNHDKETEIWLIFYKKQSGKSGISYDDAVEEALCLGWIDSIIKKIDEEKYSRKFTPRTDYKKWSELNINRVKKLISTGLMTETGLKKINLDIINKKSNELKKVTSEELSFPLELEKILKKNKSAWSCFISLAPSHKRNYIRWIISAKKEETCLKRLNEAMKLLEKGEKLGLK